MKEQQNGTSKPILITNIQRFSLHDGPGIRTTCFLKGCSLRCPWCSNPENLSPNIQSYIKDGQEGTYGQFLSPNLLYEELLKDKQFFTGKIDNFDITNCNQIELLPGGITFTGGECLLQIEGLIPLLSKLNKEHIHIAVETSLFISEKMLLLAIKYVDFFYVDIKILDEKNCFKYLHGNLQTYLSNLMILFRSGKPVVFRIPVIGGYTDSCENREKVIKLISKYVNDENANLLKIEMLKEHNLGISKYKSLAICNTDFAIPKYKGVSDELMELYRYQILERINDKIPVDICMI